MATTLIVSNPKIYTCNHCGEEYLADAPPIARTRAVRW